MKFNFVVELCKQQHDNQTKMAIHAFIEQRIYYIYNTQTDQIGFF